MSPELQKALADYLTTMLDALKSGGEVVVEQAPYVVQEILLYGRAMNTTLVAGGVVLCIISVCAFVVARTSDEDGPFFLGVVAGCVGLAMAVINLSDFIKAWYAPRLYLIEYLANLVKGQG